MLGAGPNWLPGRYPLVAERIRTFACPLRSARSASWDGAGCPARPHLARRGGTRSRWHWREPSASPPRLEADRSSRVVLALDAVRPHGNPRDTLRDTGADQVDDAERAAA